MDKFVERKKTVLTTPDIWMEGEGEGEDREDGTLMGEQHT
jgi:hypothetical protein